ncbi:MAG: hypothetical protein RL557_681 [archaeon]
MIFLLVMITFSLLLGILVVQASAESDFYDLVNNERTTIGLSALQANANLETAGLLHSKDMAEQKYFSHTSLDGRSFATRIKNQNYYPYSYIGENIAYHSGAPSAEKVFTMWMNSDGHKKNMLSANYKDMGLGVFYDGSKTYYTLDLGKRLGSSTPTPINPIPVPMPSEDTPEETDNDQNSVEHTFKMIRRGKIIYFVFSIEDYSTIYYSDGSRERKLCTVRKNSCVGARSFSLGTHTLEFYVKNGDEKIILGRVEVGV